MRVLSSSKAKGTTSILSVEIFITVAFGGFLNVKVSSGEDIVVGYGFGNALNVQARKVAR